MGLRSIRFHPFKYTQIDPSEYFVAPIKHRNEPPNTYRNLVFKTGFTEIVLDKI